MGQKGQNILKMMVLADIITLLNALLGFASVIMTLRGDTGNALMLILIAAIADGADGTVARYSGHGVLGANLDSLSDVISFGVAPAVVASFYLSSPGYTAWIFPGLFMICGTLRLARFNISGKKDGFEGIPITAGGLIAALFIFVSDLVPYFEFFLPALLLILSFLMVSSISYPKIKNPVILAPMALVLVLDITAFYLGFPGPAKKGSLFLLVFITAYLLSPVWRKLFDRDQ